MICTLTINPAIDRLLYINSCKKNNTNRIKDVKDVLGGKGTHVSVNLDLLGCENRAYGISFGDTGKEILKLLDCKDIDTKFLHYKDGNSRTNYAVIEENGCCTLFSEKGKLITKEKCEALISKLVDEIKEDDILIMSGDASNTEIPLIYCEIMDRLKAKHVKIFLDTSSSNLREGLKRKPFLIKPNEDELSQIVGTDVSGKEKEIIQGMKEAAKIGIECVTVTCGGAGSYAYYKGKFYHVHPLKVEVANTIGCGDAFLSGMAYGFANKMDFSETLRIASAISSATAESNITVGFDVERAMDLRKLVQIEVL